MKGIKNYAFSVSGAKSAASWMEALRGKVICRLVFALALDYYLI
jgi:hypothetical protein